MLRRKSELNDRPKDVVPYPDGTEPMTLAAGSAGVHFYAADEAFYLPYAGLQAMYLVRGMLVLVFVTDEVRVEGRGLHSLYVHLAEQRVKRVHEQGERYESMDEGSGVFILKILRLGRSSPGMAASTDPS